MKKKLLIIFILFLNFSFFSQNCNFSWAKSIGGINGDVGSSVAIDLNGNVYTTGFFQGTADFDPGPSVYNLTSAGGEDIFVCKFNAYGSFVWAKSMGSSLYNDEGNSITVDIAGNVYTTGFYRGTADFDPGLGVYTITSTGYEDAYISKFDASGNFIWAKSIGGGITDVNHGNSIAVDASGNVYTTGYFEGTTDFDPGAGVNTISSNGASDIFVCKLNASGTFVWAKSIGGSNDDNGNSITLDATGNIYTTGFFASTVDFDPSGTVFNLTSAGGTDIYISKLDGLGAFVWAKKMGGINDDVGYGLTIDANSNIYTTGGFIGTGDFDPGVPIYNLSGGGTFISKLDGSGSFLWAKSIGLSSGRSIALDGSNNVYTTGNFSGTTDFDPGAAVYNLTSSVGPNIFISKLDVLGSFILAEAMVGTNSSFGQSIAVDNGGNINITGYFGGTTDFDPGAGVYNLTTVSVGFGDVFVAKYTYTPTIIAENNLNAEPIISVYPNPFIKQVKLSLHLDLFSDIKIKLINVLGEEIKIIENKFLDPGNYTYEINIELNGIYFLNSNINGHSITKKIIGTQ